MSGGEASYSFTPNLGGIDRLLHDPGGEVGRYMTRIGNAIVNNAKSRARVDTGLMRSMIEFRLETEGKDLVGIVAARTNYSAYVEDYDPFLVPAMQDEIH